MIRTYEDLTTYTNLAKKTISKFAPKFYNGLSMEMLKNDDAISDVATAIMYADWRFDETRVGISGQKKTLYSYRNQCAIWAIKTYITNKYKKQKKDTVSLNFSLDNDNDQIGSSIQDPKSYDPIDIAISNEKTEAYKKYIQCIFDSGLLTKKQISIIKLYYLENETLASIGKKFGVSREAIRQNLKRAIALIKEYDTIYI
jgi:RNA polymerase sigma factor (sigma-70 family)